MFILRSTMGKYFHAFILFSSSCFTIMSPVRAGDIWNEVVVVGEDTSVILSCFDSPPTSTVLVTWKMMSMKENRWSYLLSANCIDGQTDRRSQEFEGRTFWISADATLTFRAAMATEGLYSCVVEQNNRKLQERIVLLALIKLTVTPTPPVAVDRTVRLAAQVSPFSVAPWGTWVSPSGEEIRTEIPHGMGSLLSKLPRITSKDGGVYTCRIRVHGNNVSEHRVNVTVNAVPRSVAVLSHSRVTLTCPPVLGDYVLLYWNYPDSKKMELIFQFDRWRRSYTNKTKAHLHLTDSTSLANAGNFSFLLSPTLKEGGHYICEVFLDDKAYSQSNKLSVLHGYPTSSNTTLDLSCLYSERSQVKTIRWSYLPNPNRVLPYTATLGRIRTSVALPVTSEEAGQYACTLYLKNGDSVRYVYTITMTAPTVSPDPTLPPAAVDVSTFPYVPTLSFLLFLIPMFAVAVGVLLWKRGYCITRRSVEQSLSQHSGEVENIYENPDDLRQTPPQGAVYMDLKPTGEMDVYKELERYNQCCG